MYLLYAFVIIFHVVFAAFPCEDGVKIAPQETRNPEDLIGNWSYVYHWDPKVKFAKEFVDSADQPLECPEIYIEAITAEFVKTKEAECAKYKIPFQWADAKLRVDAPLMRMKGAVIIIGDKENWMAVDCVTMARVVVKKLADNYIVMSNSDMNSETELIVRGERPSIDELKCIAHNLDVGKGMSGLGLCYK